jgi:glyoxalase family protein
VLGLRLVKRTINFDDPRTYHLYYGDALGRPGSLITFFAWPDADRGRVGPGQVAVTSFAVPATALGFWIERLLRNGVRFRGPTARRIHGVIEQVISFADHDGLMLELVATPLAPGVSPDSAVRGIHGVTLWEVDGGATARVLVDLLGFESAGTEDTTERFAAGDRGTRSIVGVRTTGDFLRGDVSVGTVHHVAWRASDDEAQLEMRDRIIAAGLDPTPVVDRQYFRSVYFREPGGVLFEIATDPPGFAVDEAPDHFGEQLMLPPQYEPYRSAIAAALPELVWPHADINDSIEGR